MRNDMYLYRPVRKRKSKFKTVIASFFLVIVACGLSGLVFLVASGKMKKQESNFPDEGAGVNIAELTKATEVTEGAQGKDSELIGDEILIASTMGPYGLWKTEKKEEIKTSAYQENVWMSDFVDTRERVESKGIYLSASYINAKFNQAMELLEDTELNAVVIDIKDDSGYITYQMDYDMAQEIGATTSCIADMEGMIAKLKERGIYVIARIVTLKDPLLAKKRPELALKNKDGSDFKDNAGLGWVNPYLPEVWDYLEGVCVACVNMGFDEVNLDYIRFSTDKGMSNVDFGEAAEEMTRIEVISQGIKRLCETIKPLGAFISCDVYGAIITSSVDAKIVGQAYREMSRYLDYICPMVYPSHYGAGYYGLDYPDIHPYELVKQAMEDSKKTLSTIPDDENKAIVRPWLQDFTASWLGKGRYIKYGVKEVRDQINAVYDAGYGEWLLWNAGINYTQGALQKE